MTMGAGLLDQRGDRVGHGVGKTIRKKKFARRTRRPEPRVPMAPTVPRALQSLFVSCRDTFRGPGTVPTDSDVQKLCDILDYMMPEDVGLSKDLHFFKPKSVVRGTPRVTYTTIYKCENFSLCLFFLPATAVIPLHNHPEMTVFSKLLLGTMHIKSYDWADVCHGAADRHDDSGDSPPSQLRLARLKTDSVFRAPCDTSVLYPTSGGNIHAFTAITPCAVLDVIGPPYSKDDGRDCSYYKEIPYTALSSGDQTTVKTEEGGCYGWLKEIESPEDSEMDGIEYLGPQINDSTS